MQRALDVLTGWEAAPADVEHLRRALQQLDELFLLVVVGEFNSGKSALINALLGEAFLPEGPTPTTDRVHILAHGPAGAPEFVQEDVRLLRTPADLLREVRIVDTTGTNAVLRKHEATPATSSRAAIWSCSSPPPTGRSRRVSGPSWRASVSGARRSTS